LEAIALPGSIGFTRMHPSTAQQLADRSTSASYCSIADAISAAPDDWGDLLAAEGATVGMFDDDAKCKFSV
jgi:hypothetical protein